MKNRKTDFLKGISIQTVITIVKGISEIIIFAILSRLLTKAEFGYLAVLNAIIAVCVSISEAGLGSALIQKKIASDAFISTTFTLSCILGILFALFVCLLSPWIAAIVSDETLTFPLMLMSLNIFFCSVISVGDSLLYRKLQFARVGIILLVSYILSSCIMIYMAAAGYGLFSVVTGSVLNSLFHAVILYVTSIKIPKIAIKKNEISGIVSFGGWLTMGVILNTITHQIDKLVLSKWLSVTALGAYNRPAGFVSSISTQINGIFDTVLFPMLSEVQDDFEKIKQIYLRSISLLNYFSALLACAFFFNAHLIIIIFFGEEWLDLVPVMQIVSISVLFNIDGRLVDCYFRSLAYVKLGFYIRAMAAIIMFISLLIGAQFGLIGVAFGMLFANVSIVLIKVLILSYRIELLPLIVFKRFLQALKPILPIIFLGIFYLSMKPSILTDILFLATFVCLIAIETMITPHFIGIEYMETIYPIINKIFFKKNV